MPGAGVSWAASSAPSASCVAKAAVPETPWILGFRMRLARNVEADDRATTTPIWSYLETTMPPAELILAAAFDGRD